MQKLHDPVLEQVRQVARQTARQPQSLQDRISTYGAGFALFLALGGGYVIAWLLGY